MRVFKLIAVALLVVVAPAGLAMADMSGDAVILVEKAAAMFQDQGKEAALKAINDPKGPLVKGDLYVFAVTMDNVLLGHPYEYSMRRLPMTSLKDADGNSLVQMFKKAIEKEGSGWTDYLWAKPGADKPSRKRAFVKTVPKENLYVGVGYYVN
jgi:signal transduction histidine kinase